MHRHVAAALFAVGLCALAAPAAPAAVDHCHRHAGEHVLARSAQAVVFERTVVRSQHFPLQTLTGCSRRSGRRRVLDVLQPRSLADPTKLIGLKLAGTRVAYAMVLAPPGEDVRTTLITEDAVHGGRRHDLGGSWPYRGSGDRDLLVSWAVDAEGDVAWLAPEDMNFYRPSRAVIAWRPGLGRRRIDARADLRGLTLHDGRLGWRRNGAARSVDLSAVRRSACRGPMATVGTLDVDLVQAPDGSTLTACLRATGQTLNAEADRGTRYYAPVIDVNGPYLAVHGARYSRFGWYLVDLVHGSATFEAGIPQDAVVTAHGSVAWLYENDFWVRDGSGLRRVVFSIFGNGPLLRDGTTITWSRGGPTVTVDP